MENFYRRYVEPRPSSQHTCTILLVSLVRHRLLAEIAEIRRLESDDLSYLIAPHLLTKAPYKRMQPAKTNFALPLATSEPLLHPT